MRRSAAELAYEALRDAIVSLALPPGTVLDRTALAARLGVSQTPLREALIRLLGEGLVEVVPQSATRVSRISVAVAREAQLLRLAVELELVRRLAADAPPNLFGVLAGQIERMRAAVGSEEEFHAADEAFHAALYRAAGVPGLRALVCGRSGDLDRMRRLHLPASGKALRVLADHEALLEALRLADPAAAEWVLRDHLSGTFAEVEALRDVAPDYFAADAGKDDA
ncbi:GntR family transcriptional regulator [Sabulicella glaciei]|uniref:GntR family transcriptional regulator n=1 Tax=Sabulicella glaciei TaxID=2984948 RepID=A0ABT3NTC1_9PROT|nr:GntR family transcriptional regulator [Roseococcus sp. MDT2-1-1]MCW8085396.1 GntR family transcriptional regulator [Roseococcus sp. MDT2-1-1]